MGASKVNRKRGYYKCLLVSLLVMASCTLSAMEADQKVVVGSELSASNMIAPTNTTDFFPLLKLEDIFWPNVASSLDVGDFFNLSLTCKHLQKVANIGFYPLINFRQVQIDSLPKIQKLISNHTDLMPRIIELENILSALRTHTRKFPDSWQQTLLKKSLTQFLTSAAADTISLEKLASNNHPADPLELLEELDLSAQTYMAALNCRVLDMLDLDPERKGISINPFIASPRIMLGLTALSQKLTNIAIQSYLPDGKFPAFLTLNESGKVSNIVDFNKWRWIGLKMLSSDHMGLYSYIQNFCSQNPPLPLEEINPLWTELNSLPLPKNIWGGGYDHFENLALQICDTYPELAEEILESSMARDHTIKPGQEPSTYLAALAQAKGVLDKTTEAIQLYETAIKKLQGKPKAPPTEHGEYVGSANQTDEFGELCYTNPDLLRDWHLEVSDLLKEEDRLWAAYDHLLKALDLAPNPLADWLAEAGLLSICCKDYQAADKHYKQALEHPGSKLILNQAEGITLTDSSTLQNPFLSKLAVGGYAVQHGCVKIKLGEYEAAEALLDKGVTLTKLPYLLNYQIPLALLKIKLHKIQEASKIIQNINEEVQHYTKDFINMDWYFQTPIGQKDPSPSLPPAKFIELMFSHLPDPVFTDYNFDENPQKLEWFALGMVINHYFEKNKEIQALLKEEK